MCVYEAVKRMYNDKLLVLKDNILLQVLKDESYLVVRVLCYREKHL